MTEDSGYVLDTLRKGSDFTLCRGRGRNGEMAVLAVLVEADPPSPQNLRRLEHEYSLSTELDSSWAAQPVALTRHDGRPALILKDPGGDFLDQIIDSHRDEPLDLVRFLRIAIGLAVALGQTHRHGLVHKDIKPANALVDRSDHVWLTGFGVASRLPRERQSPKAPESIAGSLPYMAPEQTGRMNRSIDSRSDLYSLGVTLYQMSTGRLPFIASDPMEWVHCQIARQPVPPQELAPNLPSPISAIITKLLAKTAEERYQTAVGLERDLQHCLKEWHSKGRIDAFPLGERDNPDRLLIPEKLYGRASEVSSLLRSFARVVGGGRPELILVSGYSGVGKSSVVNELHKPLVPPRGLFAAGKFDQYKRDIPYATLAQAFQGLIRPILAKDEQELGHWRDTIRDAVGPNGQLMVDLVPELKLVIGEQLPVPQLPPQDARSRFHLVFRRFIAAFTRKHPLALFLDDLQWLDSATLEVMEDLLTHPEVNQLLLIGAYRDNEVPADHPLMRRLSTMRRLGAVVHTISLEPLSRHDLGQLAADSLRCDPAHAAPLTDLIVQKTAGNPFFFIQFLYALFEEGLLKFDHIEGRWNWDLNRIRAKGFTDNVVDLMVAKLNRLPKDTQKALEHLACLGNSADFPRLRLVYRDSAEDLHRHLWDAVKMGLISRAEDSYKFLHDRVQEAAYSLIPKESRAEMHLRIGMLMAAHGSQDELEEEIFEIVNQLDRGARLITSPVERERVAGLNLLAARRAKASTAYASALNYLRAGRELLPENPWDSHHQLAFSIESLLAECELLTADMANAERRLSELAERATSIHDIALVTRLRLTLYNLLDRSDSGVNVFIQYQNGRGQNWSAHPTDEEVSQAYDQIWTLLADRNIEELVKLPAITNPAVLEELDVYTEMVMAAMFTDKNLVALVVCRMVCLSLIHGNSDASCFAYVQLAMLAGPHFGNYEAGFQFGKLGYDLVEEQGLRRYQARTYLRFGNSVMPWRRHIKLGRELVRRAFEVANRTGDLTFAAYSCNNLNSNLLAAGDPLEEVQREAQNGLEFAEKARFGRVIDQIKTQLALIRMLRGATDTFGSFSDGQFDERQFESHLSGNSTLAIPMCWYWIRKLQARFFAEDHPAAIQASSNAEPLLWASHSYIEVAEYHFYTALARAALLDTADANVRPEHRRALAGHHRQLGIYAQNCPENFENRVTLVGAEIARIEGRDLDAMRLYEQAIRSARANGFVHNEAVANETAGRFYLSRGVEIAGYAHLRNAHSGYERWGANAKARQLDGRYPRLRQDRTTASHVAGGDLAGQLDVETVVKASQALSGEIVLPGLIERLMRIAMEHAGAQRGLLILIRGGGPQIEAVATTGSGGIGVVVRHEPVRPTDLPGSALHYVMRTHESVLLEDASADDVWSKDEYVSQMHSKSILCLPIVKQNMLVGVLYLENKLTPGAFTPSRVTVLQLLASQAAISLENAGLYSDLQRSEAFLAQGQSISRTGSFGWNAASGEVYWSAENYDILEYDRGVQASMDLALQRIHPADRDTAQRVLEVAIRERKDFGGRHRLLMPDGRVKHVHTTGRAVNTGSLDFVGTVRDVTESTLAETALRQAQADLARINRATTMGELTASLAHELSQPISGSLTNAEVCLLNLGRDEPDLDRLRVSVNKIVRDAHRAHEIIGRIRSQFERGESHRELVDLNEINRQTVALLHGEAVRHQISVRMELADNLPRMIGDPVQLQQVVMNLIVNGIEAMKNVEGVREMIIKTQLGENQQLLVSVSDTGKGFPPQMAEQLFEPFFTTKVHGTGMGLRISRSIVESHNGRLWAQSAPRHGATFHVRLPAGQPLVETDP